MSGTGNTKRAAELFQLQLNSMKMECEISNWSVTEFGDWDEADAFGFAAPTHSFREPTVFRKKLKRLPKNQRGTLPCFLMSSLEGMSGNIFYRIGKILKQKGMTIIGTYTFYAPSNVLMWQKSIQRSKEMITIEHQQNFMRFAKGLPELLREKTPIKIKRHLVAGIFASITRDKMIRWMVRWKIKVDETTCIKCGLCSKNCIAQCITLEPFPKINMKKCVVCLGCINLCPKDALNSKNTIGLERYKGPGKLKLQPI